jgi:hypothetical protein
MTQTMWRRGWIRIPNMSLVGPIREYVRILVDLPSRHLPIGAFLSFTLPRNEASPRANVPLLYSTHVAQKVILEWGYIPIQ